MNIQIGTYLKVKEKIVDNINEKIIYINEKSGEEFSSEILFDPKTGEKITEKKIKINEPRNINDWYGFYDLFYNTETKEHDTTLGDDAFITPEYNTSEKGYFNLLTNGGCKFTNTYDDEDCDESLEIDTLLINKSIEEFKYVYKVEIEELIKVFGEDNVSIHYGVVIYYL